MACSFHIAGRDGGSRTAPQALSWREKRARAAGGRTKRPGSRLPCHGEPVPSAPHPLSWRARALSAASPVMARPVRRLVVAIRLPVPRKPPSPRGGCPSARTGAGGYGPLHPSRAEDGSPRRSFVAPRDDRPSVCALRAGRGSQDPALPVMARPVRRLVVAIRFPRIFIPSSLHSFIPSSPGRRIPEPVTRSLARDDSICDAARPVAPSPRPAKRSPLRRRGDRFAPSAPRQVLNFPYFSQKVGGEPPFLPGKPGSMALLHLTKEQDRCIIYRSILLSRCTFIPILNWRRPA